MSAAFLCVSELRGRLESFPHAFSPTVVSPAAWLVFSGHRNFKYAEPKAALSHLEMTGARPRDCSHALSASYSERVNLDLSSFLKCGSSSQSSRFSEVQLRRNVPPIS